MRKIKKLLMTFGLAGALAVGVGASVATLNHSEPIKANASEGNVANVAMGEGVFNSTDGFNIWTSISGIRVKQIKASSSTNVANYLAPARMYNGHVLEFSCDPGIKITKIEIGYPANKGGYDIVAGYSMLNDAVVTDAGISISKGVTTKAGKHTFTTAAAENIYIQNFYFDYEAAGVKRDKSKEQLHVNSISLTYNVDETTLVTPTEINVTTLPTKTAYKDGDVLDLTGMIVTATMSNNTTKDVTSEVSCNPGNGDNLEAGTTPVTVSLGELKTTFPITVEAIAINGEDRFIAPETLNLVNAGGYKPNNTVKNLNGLLVETYQTMLSKNGTIQVQESAGYILNKNSYHEIEKIILVESKNLNVSAGVTDTSNKLTGDTSGSIVTYNLANLGYKKFKITSPSGTGYASMIIVEFKSEEATLLRQAAAEMNLALNDACNSLNVTPEIWNNIAKDYNEGQKYATIKNSLKTIPLTRLATGEPTEIQKALSRYDYIIAKYKHNDFLNRAPASQTNNVAFAESDTMIPVIIVISVLAITSISLLFISKRRKATR